MCQLIHWANAQLQQGVHSVKGLAGALDSMLSMTDGVARAALDIQQATRHQTAMLADAAEGLVQLVRLNDANTEMVTSTVHGCESLREEAEQLLARIAQMQLDQSAAPAAGPTATGPTNRTEVEFF